MNEKNIQALEGILDSLRKLLSIIEPDKFEKPEDQFRMSHIVMQLSGNIVILRLTIDGMRRQQAVRFCEKLNKLREEKELSQAELAKLVGISQEAIEQYELNIKQPDVTVAGKIARVLGTTVDDMLWGE